MRYRGRRFLIVAQMAESKRHEYAASTAQLAVLLHDVAGGLAAGIALLKGWRDSGSSAQATELELALDLLQTELDVLRALSRSETPPPRATAATFRQELEREAGAVGIALELTIVGTGALAGAELELVRLVSREAVRNVRRHSGARQCRIELDLDSRPWRFTAMDSGRGISAEVRSAGGLSLLAAMATQMGATFGVTSNPGSGVVLTLTGPTRSEDPTSAGRPDGSSPRSLVAETTLSSRRKDGSPRPLARSGQQINQS